MASIRKHVVTVKLTPDEFEMLRAGAAGAGSTQSEFLRDCLLRDRLAELDPTAIKIIRARLGGIFREGDDELEAFLEHMLGSVRDLKLRMEVERELRRAKKT